MNGLKIGFIGAGNIAGALIGGVVKAELFAPADIYLFDTDSNKTAPFAALGAKVCHSNLELVEQADIIVLAVKPQIIDLVMREIGLLCKGKHLVSVAAGISTDYIRSQAPGSYVLRAMPNTPMLMGKGAVAIAESAEISTEMFEILCSTFSCCGLVEVVPEAQMNDIIAVNGSSPAFFYRVAAIIVDFAVSRGIERTVALSLAAKTMEGASAMLIQSGMDCRQLIQDVSSPGGTTVAALSALDELSFDDIFTSALAACANRANELAK